MALYKVFIRRDAVMEERDIRLNGDKLNDRG